MCCNLYNFREGGGCVTGTVNECGKLTGDDIVYIYPDWRTCLVGTFIDGTFVSGYQTALQSITIIKVKAYK